MANYGKRPDGTLKGTGWLGELKMLDGSNSVATEKSAGFEIDGKERLFPLIVPTLDKDELNSLLKNEEPSKSIIDKAVSHGMDRIKNGQSPFKDDGVDEEYMQKIGIRK